MASPVTTIRQLEVLAEIARNPATGRVTRHITRHGRLVPIVEFPDNGMVQTLIHKGLVSFHAGAVPMAKANYRGLKFLDDFCARIWPEVSKDMASKAELEIFREKHRKTYFL